MFSHSAHFSHMSEPILPISHLEILFLSFFCSSLTRPISPICQSPFFPDLTFQFFFEAWLASGSSKGLVAVWDLRYTLKLRCEKQELISEMWGKRGVRHMGEMGVWVEKSNTTNAPKSKKRLTHIHRLMETRPAYTPPQLSHPRLKRRRAPLASYLRVCHIPDLKNIKTEKRLLEHLPICHMPVFSKSLLPSLHPHPTPHLLLPLSGAGASPRVRPSTRWRTHSRRQSPNRFY